MEQHDHSVGGAIYSGSSFLKRTSTHPQRSSLSYGRTRGPNFIQLEKKLADLYKCDYVALCCSGLNAIAVAISSLRVRHLVVDTELYSETAKLCQYMSRTGQLTVTSVDCTSVETSAPTGVDAVFFESCSNPSGRFIDIRAVRARFPDAIFIVPYRALSTILWTSTIASFWWRASPNIRAAAK